MVASGIPFGLGAFVLFVGTIFPAVRPLKQRRCLTRASFFIAFLYGISCRVLRTGCSRVRYVMLPFWDFMGRGLCFSLCIKFMDSNSLCNSYRRERVLSISPWSRVPLVHDSDVRKAGRPLGRERFCLSVVIASPYPIYSLQIRPSASEEQSVYISGDGGGVIRQCSPQMRRGILASSL